MIFTVRCFSSGQRTCKIAPVQPTRIARVKPADFDDAELDCFSLCNLIMKNHSV